MKETKKYIGTIAMKETTSRYPGQFNLMPDPLFVAIPRGEIIAQMGCRGNEQTLNDVCLAVAVIADAMDSALWNAREEPSNPSSDPSS